MFSFSRLFRVLSVFFRDWFSLRSNDTAGKLVSNPSDNCFRRRTLLSQEVPMEGTIADTSSSESYAKAVQLETLPKELGVLLIVAGIGGVILPGPVGAPFLLLGGLILFPNTFRKVDRGFANKFPKLHNEGMKQVHRFVNDLERRYPTQA
jgi:hypothetical protein